MKKLIMKEPRLAKSVSQLQVYTEAQKLSFWDGNGKVQNKNRINRVIKKACKLTHFHFPYTDEIFTNAGIKKLKTILEDNSHTLHANLQLSDRSGRLIYLKTNRERYKNSFMPLSVKLFTQQNK